MTVPCMPKLIVFTMNKILINATFMQKLNSLLVSNVNNLNILKIVKNMT